MMQVLKPLAVNNSAVGSWLRAACPECGTRTIGIVHTVNGQLDITAFELVCVRCGLTFLDGFLDEALDLLEQPQDDAPERFNRGREDSLLHGKGLGSNQSGRARSAQFRYAIDKAHDWKWHSKKLNGPVERDKLYVMKQTVGLFENRGMKSALEMLSRKIERIERARNIKISEDMVDRISKLVRKGVGLAESRRASTPRERRIIIETILGRQGLWPA
jgi:hypothetical protein